MTSPCLGHLGIVNPSTRSLFFGLDQPCGDSKVFASECLVPGYWFPVLKSMSCNERRCEARVGFLEGEAKNLHFDQEPQSLFQETDSAKRNENT